MGPCHVQSDPSITPTHPSIPSSRQNPFTVRHSAVVQRHSIAGYRPPTSYRGCPQAPEQAQARKHPAPFHSIPSTRCTGRSNRAITRLRILSLASSVVSRQLNFSLGPGTVRYRYRCSAIDRSRAETSSFCNATDLPPCAQAKRQSVGRASDCPVLPPAVPHRGSSPACHPVSTVYLPGAPPILLTTAPDSSRQSRQCPDCPWLRRA